MPDAELPREFKSWEDCRDHYAMEAIFLGQLADRRPGPRNEGRYDEAAQLAIAANKRCAEPLSFAELADTSEGK